jgi:hypothetical protein
VEGLSVTNPATFGWVLILLVIGWALIAPMPDPPSEREEPFPFPWRAARGYKRWSGYSRSTSER